MNTTQFEETAKRYVQWIRTHQEQFWAIAATSLGAVILIFFVIHRRETENDEAWLQLGGAQGYVMQGQTAQAAKALDDWNNRFKGTSATSYAKFLRADLLYGTSNYAGAANIYADLVLTGEPIIVRPLALSAQSASLEMAGNLPAAQASAQQFLDKYPDHFLAPGMYLSQARLAELTGNASGASALYDRFVILYPQSPWTAFARARLLSLAVPAPAGAKK